VCSVSILWRVWFDSVVVVWAILLLLWLDEVFSGSEKQAVVITIYIISTLKTR